MDLSLKTEEERLQNLKVRITTLRSGTPKTMEDQRLQKLEARLTGATYNLVGLKPLEEFRPQENTSSENKSACPWEWDFFKNSFMIDAGVHARFIMDAGMLRVYLGRQEKSGKVTSISFFGNQSGKIASFLEPIIDEIDEKKVGSSGLIPFFDSLPDISQNRQREDYWSNPHLRVPGLRIRLSHDRKGYHLYVNQPASFKVREKFPGWYGPTILFSEQGVRNFVSYMREVSHMIISGI